MGCILDAIDERIKENIEKGLCPLCGGAIDEENYSTWGYVCNKCYKDILRRA